MFNVILVEICWLVVYFYKMLSESILGKILKLTFV